MSTAAFLPLLPIFILILTATSIVGLRLVRPGFKYFWLLAAVGSLFAWPLVLLSRNFLGQSISLSTWIPVEYFPVSPQLLVDQYSWPFAFALSTLVLATILTDIARATESDWASWASNLFLTALGILAVQAGNPLTLLLMWTLIDLSEMLILLGGTQKSATREKLVIGFSARIAGIFFLIGAQLYIYSTGLTPDFQNFPPQASLLFLISAILHLRVIPSNQLLQQPTPLGRNRGYISYLVTAAASFILIIRTALVGVPVNLEPLLLLICGIVGIFASLAWNNTGAGFAGMEFWILGVGTLTIAAAVRGQPGAALAWGIAALLPGGLLLLTSVRLKFLPLILFIGLIGISTFPFTPAWQGAYLYSTPIKPALILLLFVQSLFLVGFARFALETEPRKGGIERWVWIIYPWGLALLPFAQFIIGFFDLPVGVSLANTWPSIVVIACAGVLYIQGKRSYKNIFLFETGRRIGSVISAIFSFNWLFRLLWRSYVVIGQGMTYFIRVIEGDGGILWALLFLVLLVTIITQIRIGM